jgi:hypothetical protein
MTAIDDDGDLECAGDPVHPSSTYMDRPFSPPSHPLFSVFTLYVDTHRYSVCSTEDYQNFFF